MSKKTITVSVLMVLVAGFSIFYLYADYGGDKESESVVASGAWTKRYKPCMTDKQYDRNVFRVIKDIGPECGLKENAVKQLLVILNEMLSEKDKAVLADCPYDMKESLKRYFKQFSRSLNRQSECDMGGFVFLAWALRHAGHSKLPAVQQKKEYREEFKNILVSLIPGMKSTFRRILKSEYSSHKKLIDDEIENFVKVMRYKYKVLQSDPLFPAFKNSPHTQKKALAAFKKNVLALEKFSDMNDPRLTVRFRIPTKTKITKFLRSYDEHLFYKYLSDIIIPKIIKTKKSYSGCSTTISFAECPYWPVAVRMPIEENFESIIKD